MIDDMRERDPPTEPKLRVLSVDDDPSMLEILRRTLGRYGFSTTGTTSPRHALELIEADDGLDLVILDVDMPEMSGLELLRRLGDLRPGLPVVMVTGDASAETAVAALRAGAFNYVTKDHLGDPASVAHLMRRAAASGRLRGRERALEQNVVAAGQFEGLVGRSAPMRQLFTTIERLAAVDVSVLIQGESGTGKELVARAIHERSVRATGPFVAINCGAIPDTLIDSELFGHRRGAFTGAVSDRAGAFERADGGTLLLDEIGDVTADVQVRLLRVLQERKVNPVGGEHPVPIDVRILSATLIDLDAAIEAGGFRQDLYYRLNVVNVKVPPLRDRRDDLAPLVEHLVCKHAARMNRPPLRLSPEIFGMLESYDWPGNVRELENAIQRLLALNPGQDVRLDTLPGSIAATRPLVRYESSSSPAGDSLAWTDGLPLSEARKRVLDEFERSYLARLLRNATGNVSQAARTARVDRSNLRRLLTKHGLKPSDFSS